MRLPDEVKTQLRAAGKYLQEHPTLILAAVHVLSVAAIPDTTTPTTAASPTPESSNAAAGTYYNWFVG